MPKNFETNITVLNSATSTSKSLRATVPAFITSQFQLKKGDALRWIIGKCITVEIVKKEKLEIMKKER
jgi:hypothetical protein